ncbi:MAG: hypothetical protein ACLGIA_13460, partial [Actinomycetes bacterium]
MLHPAPPTIAVTGSAAGWLELQLTAGCAAAARLPDPAATVTAQRTWRLPDGTVWPVARRLAVPGPVAASAAAAGRV